MRHSWLIAAALALSGAQAVRADTVDVSSTTLVTAGEQTRFRSGTTPDVVTVVPAFEILTLSAHGITNPISDDLRIVISGWGAYDFDSRRWDNGTDDDLSGDVLTGYVQAGFLNRRLTLRLGRENVAAGVSRMIQIDGGDAAVVLPGGFRISGYAGVPVSQRFMSRSGLRSWNPVPGDLAYGGRVGWTLSVPGTPGRGLDLGASTNFVEDKGNPVREEVGVDARLQLVDDFSILGFGAYSIYDDRFSEGSLAVAWNPVKVLHVTADWRFTAPDLLLARNSILSVFAATDRNAFGAGLTYELGHGFDVGADYHLIVEPGETEESGNFYGHEAAARVDWRHAATTAGLEAFYLDSLDNGYVGGRVYGRQSFGKAFAAVDFLTHFFREKVNGEDFALTGALTAGYELPMGFSAVISGQAGVTPFLEQTYNVMAKLVYNQTYVSREVR